MVKTTGIPPYLMKVHNYPIDVWYKHYHDDLVNKLVEVIEKGWTFRFNVINQKLALMVEESK